jgi:hypothetical protein
MSQAFDAAVERARLAATDLLAAARQVIAWHSMRPDDARDDVDFAVLSRRITSYAPDWRLDDACEDVDVASRARAEIGSIAATLSGSAPGSGDDAFAAESKAIGRLSILAAECERRARVLRS